MSAATLKRAGFIAAAAATALWPRRSQAQPLATLRVAMPGAVDDGAPLLYAMHSGAFKAAGIDVNLTLMKSGAAIASAVAGGAIDIGLSSIVPLIGAHTHGIPFVFVAPAAIYTSTAPYAALLVKKDSPLKTPRDLNGKTLASPALKDLIATSNLAWIDQNGGNSTTVKIVELPGSAVLAALDNGRIDGGTLLEPRLSQALESGTVRVLGTPFDAYGKRFVISSWFSTTDYVRANTDVIRRFARVIREANAYSNTHHAATAPLLAALAKVDVGTITRSTRVEYGDALNVKELQSVVDVTAKYKVIDRPFDADELISPAVR
jgi:NitT/TauT family transport system substrate-binding protein